MNYFIITGTSKGLGQATARQLLVKGNTLFCMSRNKNKTLIEEARDKQVDLYYYEQDLNDVHSISNLIKSIFKQISIKDTDGLYLINNAGVVAPVKPIEKCEDKEIINNINVNLIAPMILVSEFMEEAKKFEGRKRVINISSGAGKHPYFGWGSYCTAKAGIDLFTQCVALEEEEAMYPVEVLSFSPGIIDTDMQKEIRSSNEEDFVQLERFINFKKDGALAPAEDVAKTLVKTLLAEQFEHGGLIDIRDLD